MERREWLQWMMASGAMSALSSLSDHDLMELGAHVHASLAASHVQPPARRTATFRVLSTADARTVTAIAEHIIPRTDTPGATDANVTAFIDHMLADWYSAAERDLFVAGLPELYRRAMTAGGARFTMLTAPQQLALLETLDGEVAALRRTNANAANAHWFSTLRYLTVYGYCTSEVGMTRHLKSWPLPGRYDGNVALER
jgi:hypothetical protein